jgi:hypothetical protein
MARLRDAHPTLRSDLRGSRRPAAALHDWIAALKLDAARHHHRPLSLD